MKSNTRNPGAGTGIDAEIPPTKIFAVLSNERRQHALQYLVTRPGGMVLGDVAEYVTIAEGPRTRDHYERVLTGLVHIHLPRLVDEGVVGYDPDRELVTLSIDPDVLVPYLELASPTVCD